MRPLLDLFQYEQKKLPVAPSRSITIRLASTAVLFSWIWHADCYESGARAAFLLSTETVTSTDRVPGIQDFHRIPTKRKFHLELLSDNS